MREPFALSDAIRIGAAIRPQCFNALFKDGKSCARGAGIEGLTGEYREETEITAAALILKARYVFERRFERILRHRVECPACSSFGRDSVDTLLEHLNDVHRWRRNATADFVAQVEEQLGYETITVEEQSNSLSSTVVGV